MGNFKEPYYLVDFNSSICNFEILINDMTAFFHNEGGSIASHYPINHLILKSGKQNLKIKIFPLRNEKSIRKDSFLKIKIFLYDSSTNNYNDTTEVFKFESPAFDKQQYSIFNLDNVEFVTQVPYKINGWENSKMLKEDKNIKIEVTSFYRKIYELVKKGDVTTISNMMKTKFEEVDKSMFLGEVDNKKELSELFSTLKSNEMILEEFPQNLKISIYGNGKVANLTTEDNETVIRFLNKKTKEDYSFPILIHKINTNSDLEIIR